MYVTYTDDELVEIGMMDPLSLDLAYGNDENGFSLVVPISFTIPKGSLIYIDGTEWGGVVRGCKPSTLGEIPTNTVTGSTWHGILAESFVCPDAGQDYYTASGDANSEIGALIARQGLDDLFDVSPEPSGFSIEYQFVRFDNVYSALRKALAGSGAKLRIEKEPGRKPMLSAVQAESFVDDYSSKRFAYSITDGTPVNHLVVLGKGELKDRIVLHLFADSEGNISQTQTLFGIDEIQSVYELSSEEDMSKLVEEGTKKLAEYQNVSSCELKLPDDESFGIGDTVGIVDEESGISIVSDVTKVIVKIDGNGTPAISNEIGEISVSNTAAGGYEASSAGATYRAGSGISISGGTISAEVTSEDLDGKASKSHSHNWESVTGKPSSFNPAAHSHDWASIEEKPETFAPSEHDHDSRYYTESEVDTKLKSKSDTTHAHEWGDIGGKPASFPPAAHGHGWGDVTGKPTSFPPSAHSHAWADVTGKPASYPPASHNHDAVYAAKAHSHAVATKDADGFLSAADKAVIESLSGGAVTGVKGAAESAYRTGNVNITAEDVGALPEDGTAAKSSALADAANGTAITAQYSGSGVSSAKWLTCWTGYKLDAISPLNARVGIGAAGANTANGWCKLTFPDGAETGWLQTTQNGILPYSANGSGLGSWDYQFGEVRAVNVYRNNAACISGTVLYANGTGSNGTVILSQDAGSYQCIRIIYRDNDWFYASRDVIWPSGKYVTLDITSKSASAGMFWHKTRTVLIAGNSVGTNGSRYGCVPISGPGNSVGSSDNQTNNIYITAVIGYTV